MRVIAAAALALAWAATWQPANAQPAPPATARLQTPLVVVAAPDAPAWVRFLRASGAAAREGTLAEALKRPAAVITGSTKLSEAQLDQVKSAVSGGERVVSPNDAVLDAVGIGRTPARTVTSATMQGLTGPARWAPAVSVRPLESASVLPVATGDGGAVVAGYRDVGRGRLLALGVDPLGDGRDGHELLPGIGRLASSFTGADYGPTRTGADVYLDPGSLHNGVSGTPAELARTLAGARAVHVAGWNGDNRDPKFDYDYQALIDALHARGILVYAWLEPPFVSERFWLDHPECREKTATGHDAIGDWRRLIALEDPTCFQLALPVYTHVVSGFAFDGVDVAELYFEPPIDPKNYTPFHPSALAQFGHSPTADPAGFRAFRTRLVTDLNRKLLQVLNGLPNAKQLDFKMTVVDNKLDPAFGDQVGSDIDALAQVARENGAALQVEDPFVLWTQGPLRYDTLVPQLQALMPAGFAYPDVNVVDREAGYPTSAMTGAELDLAMSSAARVAGYVALYSAGTVGTDDMAHVPAAVAGSAATLDNGIQAHWTVNVFAPGGSSYRRLAVDGKRWPAGAGVAVVPAGIHRLQWSTGSRVGPGLVRFTGELGTAAVTRTSMTLRYDSRAPVFAVVDRRPVDRAAHANPDGGFTVRLPPGRHTVTMGFSSTSGEGKASGPLIAVTLVLLGAVTVSWVTVRVRSR
ncbi:MAG: hypothetical protein JO086_06380 [Acidimicrobiia bacterium]|nr:hypothetical protein [Acidimicrobiia bacterium]